MVKSVKLLRSIIFAFFILTFSPTLKLEPSILKTGSKSLLNLIITIFFPAFFLRSKNPKYIKVLLSIVTHEL